MDVGFFHFHGVTTAKWSKTPDREPVSKVVVSIPSHASNFSIPDWEKNQQSTPSQGNNDLQWPMSGLFKECWSYINIGRAYTPQNLCNNKWQCFKKWDQWDTNCLLSERVSLIYTRYGSRWSIVGSRINWRETWKVIDLSRN